MGIKQILVALLSGFILFSLLGEVNATPITYEFSFTNNLALGVEGTVNGRIFGLDDSVPSNQFQAATSVIIDSVPGVFSPVGSSSGGGYQPDATLWAYVFHNEFRVDGREVVHAAFTAFTALIAAGGTAPPNWTKISINYRSTQPIVSVYQEDMNGSSSFSRNETVWDSAGAMIQKASTVPEPTTMVLFGFGIIGFAGVLRKNHPLL